MGAPEPPIGVVLAGGAGTRLGGAKAVVALAGRPLISYPLAALRAVLADVAVVAKRDSELPELGDVPVWLEPSEPRHPAAGLREALRRAEGRAVLACAVDLPLVTPALVQALAEAPAAGAATVVARAGGRLQPLFARYEAAALAAFEAADPAAPLTATVEAMRPRELDVGDPSLLLNVNTPEDLRAAELRCAQDRSRE